MACRLEARFLDQPKNSVLEVSDLCFRKNLNKGTTLLVLSLLGGSVPRKIEFEVL